MQALLFDLDGTLVDSSKGIANSFQHTFDVLKVPEPDAKTIRSFMGPPLISSFEATLPEDLVDQAVTIYRQYYHEKGQYESTLFSHITEALTALKNEGLQLYVTTSKYEPVALQMCQDLEIATYFHGIYGSSPDRVHKADVIQYALSSNGIPRDQALIIGDTKFDLIGGQTVGIKTMAVTWGFGDLDDLLLYSPDYICHTPLEILSTLKK